VIAQREKKKEDFQQQKADNEKSRALAEAANDIT